VTRKLGAPRALAERTRIVLAAADGLKEIAAKVAACATRAGTPWPRRLAMRLRPYVASGGPFGLQPHRVETFKLSSDPLFVDKVRDVVGLYLSPPGRAVVLSVDEKLQVHAIDRPHATSAADALRSGRTMVRQAPALARAIHADIGVMDQSVRTLLRQASYARSRSRKSDQSLHRGCQRRPPPD